MRKLFFLNVSLLRYVDHTIIYLRDVKEHPDENVVK